MVFDGVPDMAAAVAAAVNAVKKGASGKKGMDAKIVILLGILLIIITLLVVFKLYRKIL